MAGEQQQAPAQAPVKDFWEEDAPAPAKVSPEMAPAPAPSAAPVAAPKTSGDFWDEPAPADAAPVPFNASASGTLPPPAVPPNKQKITAMPGAGPVRQGIAARLSNTVINPNTQTALALEDMWDKDELAKDPMYPNEAFNRNMYRLLFRNEPKGAEPTALRPGAQPGQFLGGTVAPNAVYSPEEWAAMKQKHPFMGQLQAAGEEVEGLTVPSQATQMSAFMATGALGGTGIASKMLSSVIQGGFSMDMIDSVLKYVPEARDAWAKGDPAEVERILFHMTTAAAFAEQAAEAGVRGGEAPKPAIPGLDKALADYGAKLTSRFGKPLDIVGALPGQAVEATKGAVSAAGEKITQARAARAAASFTKAQDEKFEAFRKAAPSTRGSAYEREDFDRAIPEIAKRAATMHAAGEEATTVKGFVDAANQTVDELTSQASKGIPRDAVATYFNPLDKIREQLDENPKTNFAAKGMKVLDEFKTVQKIKGKQEITLGELDDLRSDLNKLNDQAMSKIQSYDRTKMRVDDPAFAAQELLNNAIKDYVYNDPRVPDAVRNLRKTVDSTIKLREAAERQSESGEKNVPGTGKPTLGKKIAAGVTGAGVAAGTEFLAAPVLTPYGAAPVAAATGAAAYKGTEKALGATPMTRDQLIESMKIHEPPKAPSQQPVRVAGTQQNKGAVKLGPAKTAGPLDVAAHADAFNAERGNPAIDASLKQHDPEFAKRVADAYDAMKHAPNNPKVRDSYEALMRDTKDQWDYAVNKMGMKFEPWDEEGQPYANSKEMIDDVRNNKHLYFFQGGDIPVDHPMREVDPDTGRTYQEMFRSVHDLFGHAANGFQFGPKGEENAYLVHRQMFSPEAVPAMTALTRGQNSWVNFGKHMRNAAGEIPEKGQEGYVPPTERPYAQQKVGVLPDEFNQDQPMPSAPIRENLEGKKLEWQSVSPAEYRAEIDKNPQKPTLIQATSNDLRKYKIFSPTVDGKPSGIYYSIAPDGELSGVINNGPYKGAVKEIFSHAVQQGARWLSAWDIKGQLPGLYEKNGAKVVRSTPYDAQTYGEPSDELKQAWRASGWDGGKYPNLVDMVMPGIDPKSVNLPAEAGSEFDLTKQTVSDLLKNKFGTTNDPLSAGFILNSGEMVPVRGEHDQMLNQVLGSPTDKYVAGRRVGFINDENAIRVRYTPNTRKGNLLTFSVPEGVNEDQIQQMRRAVGAMGRYGNIAMEVARPGGLYTEKDFARPSDIEPMLRQIHAHPEDRVAVGPAKLSQQDQTDIKMLFDHYIDNPQASAENKQWAWQQFSKLSDGEFVPPTEIPPERIPVGDTAEGVRIHELVHHVMGDKVGFPAEYVGSHLHPKADPTTSAFVEFDLSSIGDRELDGSWGIEVPKVRDNIDKMIIAYMSGGVGDEVYSGIPMSRNRGLSGDLKQMKIVLDAMGFTKPEQVTAVLQAADRAIREHLQNPAVERIIREAAKTREAGLPETHLYSGDRLKQISQQIREATNEGQGAGNQGRPVEGLPSGNRENVAGGEEAGAGNIAAQARTEVSLPPEISVDPESDKIIRAAGAIPGGLQQWHEEGIPDYATFHDPTTGSTLSVAMPKLTEDAVREQLAKSRAEYAAAAARKAALGPAAVRTAVKGSTVQLMNNPLPVKGTGEGGEPTTVDVAKALNKYTTSKLPTLELGTAEPAAMVKRGAALAQDEAKYQLAQDNTGEDWYKSDMATHDQEMQAIRPELKDPAKMSLFKWSEAVLSSGHKPYINNKKALQNWDNFHETGKFSPVNANYDPTQAIGPNNRMSWGPRKTESYALAMDSLNRLVAEKGEKGAVDWLLAEHPLSELRQWMTESQVPVRGKATDMQPGYMILGAKRGPFGANLHGIETKFTADMWVSRTWNRWMGTMEIDPKTGEMLTDSPRNDSERKLMEQSFQAAADKLKKSLSSMQAVLWYYEQALYTAHGVPKESWNFADAAKRVAAQDREASSFNPENEPESESDVPQSVWDIIKKLPVPSKFPSKE